MSKTSRWSLAVSVSVLCAGSIAWTAQSKPLHAIVTSPAGRDGYLGHAVMWTDPGVISPLDLRNGPPGRFPYTFDEATKRCKRAGGDDFSPCFGCAPIKTVRR